MRKSTTTVDVDQIRESPKPSEKKWTVKEVETGNGYAEMQDEYGNTRRFPLHIVEKWRLCDPDPIKDHALKNGLRLNEKLPEPAPDWKAIVQESETKR